MSNVSGHLPSSSKSPSHREALPKSKGICKVFVIFGGDTSERQVSLMSGTNVWLNLQAFDDVSIHIEKTLGFKSAFCPSDLDVQFKA